MRVLSHEFNSRCVHSHEFNSRCVHSHPPENPRLIQFQIIRILASMRVLSCSARLRFGAVTRVSHVLRCARVCGAVCRLTAVPASEAAHGQPAELLVCVALGNPRLIQFQINHNFSVFRVHARPFARVQFSSRPFARVQFSSRPFAFSRPCASFRVPRVRGSAQ
jgi:hypothetical protein